MNNNGEDFGRDDENKKSESESYAWYDSKERAPYRDGVYPDDTNYGYNGDVNKEQGYNMYGDQNNNPAEMRKKDSEKRFFVPFSIFLCILLCALCFLVGKFYGGFPFFKNPNMQDGTGDPDDKNNPTSNGSEHLQNGDFKLETVTAEEHYKMSSVYQMTCNSVVEITTESVQTGSFMQQYVTTGAGSGVIISEDGYIVTNNHVIDGATKITVTLKNGDKYEAALVGTDAKTDLAVIKIEATELSKAILGKSGDMLVGEQILVVGNPLGSLGGSATSGIISALARQISIEGQMMTLIQTNAAVNPGNSGGAMFNMAGQLIGVVNAKYTDEAVEGIGFAIPIDIAKGVIEDLANYGYVTGRPNIGVTIEYGTSRYFQSVGSTNWITEVASGSDAEKAGLKSMDQIISVDDRMFTNAESLNAYLDGLKVGDNVTFVIRRYTSVNYFEYRYDDLTLSFTLSEYKGK